MTANLVHAKKLPEHHNYKTVVEAFKKVAERRQLKNIQRLNLDDLRIAHRNDKDFTIVTLFYEKNDKIFIGLGTSKRNIKDKRFRLRGVIYASNDALQDLDMELGSVE